jgi:hypothetical protein
MQSPSLEVSVYSIGLAKITAEFDESVTAVVDYGDRQHVVHAPHPVGPKHAGMILVCIDQRVMNTRWLLLKWICPES